MEKFLFLRLACFIMLLPFFSSAQEYAVFKASGKPTLTEGSKTLPITKGAILKTGKVSLSNKDALVMVNNKGNVFEIAAPGKYAIEEFPKHQKKNPDENFSAKYFSYVWRQISQEETTRTHTGNVYRESLIDILNIPADSASIFKNEVTFTWQPQKNSGQYYFFLKNKETKTISKMKIGGNSITLYPGSNLLEKGETYYWGVATTEYPDFTRIKMNQLNYLNNEQFENKKEEMSKLVGNLKSIGFSESEIAEQLCQY